MRYQATFVHRISSRPEDKTPTEVELPDGAFSNKNTLAQALRVVGVIPAGTRLNSFRVEGDRTICFPARGWHSVTLQAAP